MTARTLRPETIYEAPAKYRHVCERPQRGAELGTIVRNRECGHYWHMCWQDGGLAISPYWGRVRFWNLVALWRIWRS